MNLRIFVVDDEECIRDTFKWHLESFGHEVLTAPEPLLCSVYQGHQCDHDDACGDVLLVDYNMPRMNGIEFIDQMAQRGCKGATENKFIMSGNTSDIDMAKARKLGCSVLDKPISLTQLELIIEEAKKRIDPARKLTELSVTT